MNTLSQQLFSNSQDRRAFLRSGFATAVACVLGSCDDPKATAATTDDKKGKTPPTSGLKSLEKEKPGRPTMPTNAFKILPQRPKLDKAFIAGVEKITMDQRKSKMSAFQGGGKASDETDQLLKLGLRPFDTLTEIQTAYEQGKLVQLPSIDEDRYFAVDAKKGDVLSAIGEADLKNRPWYNLIHEDALNRFNQHVAGVFYAKTGKMLKVTGLIRSEEYQAKLRKINVQATKKISPHTFGRTIDFSIPEVFNLKTGKFEPMSTSEREFISKLLTYYEVNFPARTSWLVELKAYHGTHYPVDAK